MVKLKNLPLALFGLFSLKILAMGASYEAAVSLLVLGAVAAFYEFKSQDKTILDLKKEIQENQKFSEDLKKDHEALKTHVSSMKLSAQMRSANPKFGS